MRSTIRGSASPSNRCTSEAVAAVVGFAGFEAVAGVEGFAGFAGLFMAGVLCIPRSSSRARATQLARGYRAEARVPVRLLRRREAEVDLPWHRRERARVPRAGARQVQARGGL